MYTLILHIVRARVKFETSRNTLVNFRKIHSLKTRIRDKTASDNGYRTSHGDSTNATERRFYWIFVITIIVFLNGFQNSSKSILSKDFISLESTRLV